MKSFLYEKPNGEQSHRDVFVLREPTDLFLAIDLTEFDEDEKAYYEGQLNNLVDSMKQEISLLGLDKNYRNFKEERILWVGKKKETK